MKPRLTAADLRAFEHAKALKPGQSVRLDGARAVFQCEQTDRPGVLCFHIGGRMTLVHAGDPRLLTLQTATTNPVKGE